MLKYRQWHMAVRSSMPARFRDSREAPRTESPRRLVDIRLRRQPPCQVNGVCPEGRCR